MTDERDQADDVFDNAMCFVLSYRYLTGMIDGDAGMKTASVLPTMTMAALTIELLLKACHALDIGKVPHGHDLLKLYEGLPDATQREIDEAWERGNRHPTRARQLELISKHSGVTLDLSLTSQLDNARKAFERFRYAHETPLEGNLPTFVLDQLPFQLAGVLQRRRKHWQNWRPRLPSNIKVGA